jgi:regulator of sigma E protease
LISILSFLAVIVICVVIHEGGHYAAAVWRGVQVHEFAFGMGPCVISKRAKNGTLWSWRLLPIGGYVRMEGEEDEPRPGDSPDPARSFNVKRPWERFVIIAGGAFMNIVLAWALMAVFLSANPVLDQKSPVIGKLMPGYPAESMGARPGDRVLSINGQKISEWPQIRQTLQKLDTDEVSIVVMRDGGEVTLSGTVPFAPEQGARLWGVQPSTIRYPVHQAVLRSVGHCWDMTVMMLGGLWKMITRQMAWDVSGPVGIAKMAGDAASQGLWTFITFLAVINMSLGIMNLLPLPALDGGRLVFLFGEMLSGRKFPERWENRIHLVGFVLLLTLIVLVTWQDIMKLLGGN